MADIGVLELQIRDNAGQAGEGLNQLAGALSRVKEVAGTSFGLGNVSKAVKNLHKSINEATGTSGTIKNITSLFNSLSSISKIKSLDIDTSSLDKVKEAFKGFDIGNSGSQMKSLREALSKEWDTTGISTSADAIVTAANSIASNGVAEKLGAASKAISAYAKAYGEIPKSTAKMNNILDAGTQLKELKEAFSSGWQSTGVKNAIQGVVDIANELSQNGTASKLSEVAKALKDYAKAYEAVPSAIKEGSAILGATPVSKGRIPLNLQQFGEKRKEVPGQMQMELEQNTPALTELKTQIEDGTERAKQFVVELKEVKDVVTSIKVPTSMSGGSSMKFGSSAFDDAVKGYAKPLEYMQQRFINSDMIAASMTNTFDAVLPKISKLSLEEAILAGNARAATAAIEGLISRLNLVGIKNKTGKGFSNIVDMVTGITRGSQVLNNSASESAKVFEQNADKVAQVESALDQAKELKEVVAESAEGSKDLIDLSKVPSSGMNGAFENAAEEVKYLNDQLAKANENVKFWEDTYSNAQKQIKYNGATEERTNMLGHAEQGFYQAMEEAEKYGNALVQVNDYVKQYSANTKEMVQEIKGQADVTVEAVEKVNDAQGKTALEIENIKNGLREATAEELEYARHFQEVLDAKREEAALANEIRAAQENGDYRYGERLMQGGQAQPVAEVANVSNTGSVLAGIRDDLMNYAKALWETVEATAKAVTSTFSLRAAFNGLKSGIQKMFPTISGMLKRLGGIAKYRALRAVLKHISDGFKEGFENLKGYKEAIGDEFSAQIKEANAQLLTMKNSIGAAVAPAFQALLPILNSIVSAVITVINWVNQLISLLTGKSTWTKATEASADSLDNVKKSAGGASKAVKDLLADWDELNIIQSESGGGGGGGGGKAEADYASMFEEMTEFDQKIKDIISFIDEHMGGIWEVVQLIGTAILGWKISKAFDNVLGYIGRLIAGGALLTLGFKLSYGAGYEAGKKGGYELQEIIESALGTIAAGVGGALIFGTTGAIIAISVTALLNFLGFKRGEQDRIDEDKWGDLHLTQEEVEAFVREQFTFDVDATVNLLKGHIENEHSAREDLNTQIENFSKSLNEAKANVALNVDSEITSQSVVNASADALDAIANVQALINASNAGLTFTLKEFTFKDSDGKDISGEILSSIKIADTVLSDYFTGIGQKIADLILEGEKSGWANGEAEQALALMESQKRIYDRAAELRRDMETDSKIKQTVKNATKNGVFDRETANASMEEQKKLLKEVEETTRQQKEELASNYYYLASLAQASAEEAGLDTEQGGALKLAADTYREKADKIVNGMEKAVKDKLADTKKTMAAEWAEALKIVYGEDLFKNIGYSTDEQGSFFEWFDNLFGEGHSTKSNLERFARYGDYDKAADYVKQAIADALTGTDPNGIMEFVLKDLGMDPVAFLNDEMRELVAKNVIKNSGNNDIAFEIMKSLFNFDKEEATKYFGSEFTSNKLWETAQDEIEEGVKKGGKFTVGATGMEFDFTEFKEEVKHGVEGLTWEDDPIPVNIIIDPVIPDFGGDQLTAEDLGITEPVVIPVVFEDAEESILEQLNRQENTTGRHKIPGVTQVSGDMAFAGAASGVQFAPYNPNAPQETQTEVKVQDISGDVQRGVQNGSTSQVGLLQQLVSLCSQIAAKPFNVTVSPSADWGFHNQRSGDSASYVTGDIGR